MITMTLTLLTFCLGALADYVINRRAWKSAARKPVLTPAPSPAAPKISPSYVEGFLVPGGLRYHSGHTWVEREQDHTARVGVDEFAARLAGNIDTVELPRPGQWFRQGQPLVKLHRNGETATLLAPIEGEVVEVNTNVEKDPSLLRRDAYGKGWLMTLHVDDPISPWRNLLPVNLVKNWMEETVSRLSAKQPALAGEIAADGKRPKEDLLAALPGADWSKITAEFFLP
jgi:glycine cleavage system H protein